MQHMNTWKKVSVKSLEFFLGRIIHCNKGTVITSDFPSKANWLHTRNIDWPQRSVKNVANLTTKPTTLCRLFILILANMQSCVKVFQI